MLHAIVQDVQELLREELSLAKVEVGEKVDRAKGGAICIGPAIVAGLLASMCLVAAGVAALALFIPVWAACLIVSALLSGAAWTLFERGKSRLHEIHALPEQTVESIKETVAWVKQRTR